MTIRDRSVDPDLVECIRDSMQELTADGRDKVTVKELYKFMKDNGYIVYVPESEVRRALQAMAMENPLPDLDTYGSEARTIKRFSLEAPYKFDPGFATDAKFMPPFEMPDKEGSNLTIGLGQN